MPRTQCADSLGLQTHRVNRVDIFKLTTKSRLEHGSCLQPIYVLKATDYRDENHTSQLAGITAGILCDFLLRRENDKNTRTRQ
jgi:hypothetical protein